MDEILEDDFMDTVSDISMDSIQESPNSKAVSKIQFSKHPKTFRDHAAKVRQIERKIMLGLLMDTEEMKLRKSKYFSSRFEKLLDLSKNTKKANLYKHVTSISLNDIMINNLQKKADTSPNNVRRKHLTKLNNLRIREKAVEEKILNDNLSQNEVNGFLRDMYFVVKFGDNLLTLDHNDVYKPEDVGTMEIGKEEMICDYCQSSVEKNRFGQHEELLVCKDCGNKAHPSCLSYSAELVEQIRADDSWQCIDCKACIICEGTGDPDTLLFCDACDKGYHMQCHSPKLEQMPSGKWACAGCEAKNQSTISKKQEVLVIDDEEEKTADKIKSTTTHVAEMDHLDKHNTPQNNIQHPVLPIHQPGVMYHPPAVNYATPSPHGPMQVPLSQPQIIPINYLPTNETPHVLGKGVQNNLTHILNPKVPMPDVRSSIREDVLRALPLDVADWTVQDVGYYFKSHGYVHEGLLLQEQEIDGRALLLMSRNDCLSGLRIKLGPALKIYHMHIHKLQSRTDFLG